MEEQRKYAIANQLLKSGTSIGANVREAQSAESREDFIHKLKVADKEVMETEYWIDLCQHANSYPKTGDLKDNLIVIKKLLSRIISTAKKRRH